MSGVGNLLGAIKGISNKSKRMNERAQAAEEDAQDNQGAKDKWNKDRR